MFVLPPVPETICCHQCIFFPLYWHLFQTLNVRIPIQTLIWGIMNFNGYSQIQILLEWLKVWIIRNGTFIIQSDQTWWHSTRNCDFQEQIKLRLTLLTCPPQSLTALKKKLYLQTNSPQSYQDVWDNIFICSSSVYLTSIVYNCMDVQGSNSSRCLALSPSGGTHGWYCSPQNIHCTTLSLEKLCDCTDYSVTGFLLAVWDFGEKVCESWRIGEMKELSLCHAGTKGYSHLYTHSQSQNVVLDTCIFIPICRLPLKEHTYQRLGFQSRAGWALLCRHSWA